VNNFNAAKATLLTTHWIKEWFEKNASPVDKCVIGISGGKDSTVVAGLCVKALGKERVIGVLMPNGFQADIEDAIKVVSTLGIDYYVINIRDAFTNIVEKIKINTGTISEQALINLPARLRMTTLYAVSQTFGGRVANTCNLSEDYIGYSTRWGDSVGDFSPLANFTTEEVIAIGHELGLPAELVDKIPSDGLCGKTDEDNLRFSYKVLNEYIRTGYIEDKELKKKIDERHERNLFKLNPIPTFNYFEETKGE